MISSMPPSKAFDGNFPKLETDAELRARLLLHLDALEREDLVELAEVRRSVETVAGDLLWRLAEELLSIVPGHSIDVLARPLFEADEGLVAFIARVVGPGPEPPASAFGYARLRSIALDRAWERDELGLRTHYRRLVRAAMPALRSSPPSPTKASR